MHHNDRFTSLKIDGKLVTGQKLIEDTLHSSPFYWLLDCEMERAVLEAKDGVIYWKNGTFFWGDWKWGVFENGEFRSGTWNGGIFFGGTFKGKFLNGVFKGGEFKGEWVNGQKDFEKL